MFSFFSEVCDFFSQFAFLFNWAWDFVVSFLGSVSETYTKYSEFSADLPSELSWILPSSLGVLSFHFIRHHW